MSETVSVLLLLAKFPDDHEPVVVAAVDRAIWEHWSEEEEAEWRDEARKLWGAHPTDYEMRDLWAEFAPDDLAAAFRVPTARGSVHSEDTAA